MTSIKLTTLFFVIGLYSCGQNSNKHKNDPAAVKLNNEAMRLASFINNTDSANKAISLLDRATSIDSNYFLGYYNKLMFYGQLKQYDKAILTTNKLIKLRPSAHDLYLWGGLLYEKIGDTVSSQKYFQQSLTICDSVLDTMHIKNRDYFMIASNKAINLVMLGDSTKANEILKKLYENLDDQELKKMTILLMNKNKVELLKQLATSSETEVSSVSPVN
jgi:tetratricopeptide (TPR) repeat protein